MGSRFSMIIRKCFQPYWCPAGGNNSKKMWIVKYPLGSFCIVRNCRIQGLCKINHFWNERLIANHLIDETLESFTLQSIPTPVCMKRAIGLEVLLDKLFVVDQSPYFGWTKLHGSNSLQRYVWSFSSHPCNTFCINLKNAIRAKERMLWCLRRFSFNYKSGAFSW